MLDNGPAKSAYGARPAIVATGPFLRARMPRRSDR
jgi:hypothetical protein